MATEQTKEQLVEELAALNREELNEKSLSLDLKISANAKDDTVRNKIVESIFNEEALDGSMLKVKILLPVAGRFLLSYKVGEEVEIEEKQAQELIEAKYAEAVK